MPDEGHEHALHDCHYRLLQGGTDAHIHCHPHDLDIWSCMATSGGICYCVHVCNDVHGTLREPGGPGHHPGGHGKQQPPPAAGGRTPNTTTLDDARAKLIQDQVSLHYRVMATAPPDWPDARNWWKAARSITRYHAAHFAKLVALYNFYGSTNLPGRREFQQSLKNVLDGKAPDGGTLKVISGPVVVAPGTISPSVDTNRHQHGHGLCDDGHNSPPAAPVNEHCTGKPQHGLFECVQYAAPAGAAGFSCTHAVVGADDGRAREHVEDILFCYLKNNEWLATNAKTEFNVMARYAWLLKRLVEGLCTVKRDHWYHASNQQAAGLATRIYVRPSDSDDRP